MTDLTISVRQLKALVSPVLPFAHKDAMLPVLNAVHIESRGKWLIASATDRFVAGFQRLASTEGEWPEWDAIVPLSTLKGVLSAFKPSSRDTDPQLVLRVREGGLQVTADSALLDMLGADITYPLETGTFPNVAEVVAKAIAEAPEPEAAAGFNWELLSRFRTAQPSVGAALTIRVTSPRKASIITDGADFVGIIMPRRLVSGDSTGFAVGDGWDALLGDKPAPKKKAPRKKASAKTPAKAAS